MAFTFSHSPFECKRTNRDLLRCSRWVESIVFSRYAHTRAHRDGEETMAAPSRKVAFSNWKHRHNFTLVEVKGNNVYVQCKLCPGNKVLSTGISSNSNLLKHLTASHHHGTPLSTAIANPPPSPGAASLSSSEEGDGSAALKQAKLDFAGQTLVSKAELNRIIARYVVENMLPLSTVESESFRALVAKIPSRGREKSTPLCRKTFAAYIDNEYGKMNVELKKSFEELQYISTTADIWTAHNKSYIGVTAHWIDPNSMERNKTALACRRFKGRHTYDTIAVELDDIHSMYGITDKITATVTDNGSNFVKAFKMYQPVESDSEDGEDEVPFTDVNDVLHSNESQDGDGVVIALPPHHRCASHTLNLISCTDVEKWLLSKPDTKAAYRSAVAKCTTLWNKASRSTLAAEALDEVISKKLLVPCSTRWNSFYDALARISEISMADLSTISLKLGLAAITEREHQFIKEYCTVMQPLTIALDILQGEGNCFHGTLLPTLEMLMVKTQALKDGLQKLKDLPDAIVTVRVL